MYISEKLICPNCGRNCHTLHQEIPHTTNGKADQLNYSLQEKGSNTLSSLKESHVINLICLYCGQPCHVVVSLSSGEPHCNIKLDQEEEHVGSQSHTAPLAEVDVKEEKSKKSNFNIDGVADLENTKLFCSYCEHGCHSIDRIGPNNVPQTGENEVKL